MQEKGFVKFKIHQHTQLWKEKNTKEKNKGYGTQVANAWYWYKIGLMK